MKQIEAGWDLRRCHGEVVGLIVPRSYPLDKATQVAANLIADESSGPLRLVLVSERGVEQIPSERIKAAKGFSPTARALEIEHIALRIVRSRLAVIENEEHDLAGVSFPVLKELTTPTKEQITILEPR